MSQEPAAKRGWGWWLAGCAMLLLALVGLMVGTAWNRQATLIDEISAMGGAVETRPVGPEWLRKAIGEDRMRGWDAIVGINLADRQVDDEWLRRLDGVSVKELTWVDVTNTGITTDGLERLGRLPALKQIYILETQIKDEQLAEFDAAHGSIAVIRGRKEPFAASIAMINVHSHALTCAAFHPDDRLLAVGSGEGIVQFWDVRTEQLVSTIAAHDNWVFDVDFTPDGTRLLTAGGDNTVRIWNVHSGELLGEYSGHTGDVHAVVLLDGGRQFASAGDDMTIHIVDLSSLSTIAVLEGHTEPIPSLAVNPDGTRLVSGSRDDTVRLWDLATHEEIAVLTAHENDVHSVAFRPDGSTLATASYDGSVKLWNPATGEVRETLRGHEDWVFTLAYAPDGSLVSGDRSGVIRLWREDLDPVTDRQHAISRLAFTSDGRWLASTAAEGNICLWNMDDLTLRSTLRISPRRQLSTADAMRHGSSAFGASSVSSPKTSTWPLGSTVSNSFMP